MNSLKYILICNLLELSLVYVKNLAIEVLLITHHDQNSLNPMTKEYFLIY